MPSHRSSYFVVSFGWRVSKRCDVIMNKETAVMSPRSQRSEFDNSNVHRLVAKPTTSAR